MPKIQEHIKLAYDYGVLRKGYTFEDYLILAVLTRGYETIAMWGVQGSGKSTRMLQALFWILRFLYTVAQGYIKLPEGEPRKWPHRVIPELVVKSHEVELGKDQEREIWLQVLDAILFKPSEFVERLEAVPDDVVIPALGWDDVLVHYPSSTFKTNIKQYGAVDSTWAAIRTKVSVMFITLPIIDRLAKNIKDNVSFELYLGKNQKEMIKRIFHLPGIARMESNYFKIIVERPEAFDLYAVPKWVWDMYWRMRLDLTREALVTLRGATDMGDPEGYTMVLDLAEDLRISPNTIQQMISRGVMRGKKVDGLLYIDDEFIPRLKKIYDKRQVRERLR